MVFCSAKQMHSSSPWSVLGSHLSKRPKSKVSDVVGVRRVHFQRFVTHSAIMHRASIT